MKGAFDLFFRFWLFVSKGWSVRCGFHVVFLADDSFHSNDTGRSLVLEPCSTNEGAIVIRLEAVAIRLE